MSRDGRTALDIGASTGGFTQVLLERGAAKVHAVDVGHGQLRQNLRDDPRVVVHEGLNARHMTSRDIPDEVRALVADVSFISLRLVLPAAMALCCPGAWLVALVKPQFELGRAALNSSGVVADQQACEAAAQRIAEWISTQGWVLCGVEKSPLRGGDGNVEYLVGAKRARDPKARLLARAVDRTVRS